MEMNNSVLIIGHPATGKTTFIVQFYIRVMKRKSSIKLTKTPENINAITDAVRRITSGEEPMPTPAEENVEVTLPIKVDGKNIDLVCPDYGGEQVNNLTALMEIDSQWEELVNRSNRWMLFIRPHMITSEYDLSISSYAEIAERKSTAFTSPGLSDQSKFIELLQVLLYTKNKGLMHSIVVPKLSLVLSCWDELNLENKKTPVQVLYEKMPLLLHFVETAWVNDAFRVFGLSAQEFPLTTQEAKHKYLNNLPENFGYMVDQEGAQDKDITKLVEMAL